MKKKVFDRCLTGFVALLLSASAFGGEFTAQGDGLDVTLTTASKGLEAGEVPFEIKVTDSDGAIIDDAKVKVFYGMPTQPGMPPMDYDVSPQRRGDAYHATLYIDMEGEWYFKIKVRQGGSYKTVKTMAHFVSGSEGAMGFDHSH